jgi:glycosyltransferase involved in cell wall biosynthesis
MQPLLCEETPYDHQSNSEIKLLLPVIFDSDLPYVSIVVPTYNRAEFKDLILRNWESIDYPRNKLEMVVLDDSELPQFDNFNVKQIKYTRINKKLTIGQKRNMLCNLASYNYIVHMDDDDWYPKQSVVTRIRVLLEHEKKKGRACCVGCNKVLCFDLLTDQMFESYDRSVVDGLPATLSESTMAYSRKFWNEQKWNDKSVYGECIDFLKNRHDVVCNIPSSFVVVQFSHNSNTIKRNVNMCNISQINGQRFKSQLTVYDNKIIEELKMKIIKDMPIYRETKRIIKKYWNVGPKKIWNQNIPPEVLKNELFIQFVRQNMSTKKTSTGRDVAYYCGPGEYFRFSNPWNPNSVGLGGSEEAVINLSKYLVQNNFRVTVYCVLHGKSMAYDGVMYKNYWEWIPNDKQDITIIWRDPSNCRVGVNSAKIFLDLHDLIEKDWLAGINGVNIMFKSNFHRESLITQDLLQNNFLHVIPNGIDLPRIDLKKQKGLMVCTSSPDRCLGGLLDILPIIRKEFPHVEIYWAYGFGAGVIKGGMENHDSEIIKKWVVDMKEKIRNTEGFKDLGRLSQSQINELYAIADYFIYPTTFPEIDCISLTKALYYGSTPLVTPSGAMVEKLGLNEQICKMVGDRLDYSLRVGDDYFDQYLNDVLNALKSEKMKLEYDVEMYNWSIVGAKWVGLFI